MSFRDNSKTRLIWLCFLGFVISCGSVYYNTFFNAKTAFNTAESERKKSSTGRVDQRNYEIAIDKSLKVIEDHPNSKYYDDALYVLGVSYYHLRQPRKAERRFRELLANYEQSEFVRDATVYMAKAKLDMGEEDDAMAVFEDIFSQDYSNENKTEAALSLGTYYFDNEDYDRANSYYLAVRDSLGSEEQKRLAQTQIARGYYSSFQFGEALGAYLQILGMDPTTPEKYVAINTAAQCSFRLQRISAGMEYLERLMADELYFDSLGTLKLQMAEGFEIDGDIELAADLYLDVAETEAKKQQVAYANYRLGLIYQFDYDDLELAKKYYDLAIKGGQNSEIGKDALQRSTDIGKLQTFSKKFQRDSTTTQEVIDDAAFNQFLLAELYWFALDKPDSALREMQYLVDSFPNAYDAPNAMIALSQMHRDLRDDSAGADSILDEMLDRYPNSDFVPLALKALNLEGTEADTGYAEHYLHKAEDFLVDEDDLDSARAYYQHIVDNYPDSKYYLKARFNLILLTELYDNPEDSSIFFAYKDFADSFPGSEYAREASAKIQVKGQRIISGVVDTAKGDSDDDRSDRVQEDDQAGQAKTDDRVGGGYGQALQNMYTRPNGDTIVLLDLTPVQTVEAFEFPDEAFALEENFIQIFFHILLDFAGEVVEVELKTPSEYDEVNARAERTVRSMTFNPVDVSTLVSTMDLPESPDDRGHWFVYKFLVKKPDFLR